MLKVYYDPSFLKHQPGGWHPESSARLESILEIVGKIDGIELVDNCREATRDEIELVHTSRHFDYIKSLPLEQVMIDPDTGYSEGSWEASLKAVGATVEAAKFVTAGENRRAFCAVRPPGHHASPDRTKGFCIFNNIAIAAAYALKAKLAERIAIIDWDVHHGNGTQAAFYANPDVLYISSHQYPFYPGTGSSKEKGESAGEGYTLNIPLAHAADDAAIRNVYADIAIPEVDKFKPDLIMISAGFDAHAHDPLAGLNFSSEIFGELTKMVVDLAGKHCYGRIVSVLEGGYNLIALKESVEYHLKELLNG